ASLQDIYIDDIKVKDLVNHPEFSITGGDYTICINPGETINLQVNFIMTVEGTASADLSFDFLNCGKIQNAIHIVAERRDPYSKISVDTSPIDLGNFSEEYKDFQLNIANTGYINLLRVTDVTFSDPSMAQHFEILTALPLEIMAGSNALLDIRFRPTGFNQNVTTNIIINHDASRINNVQIPFTGNRYATRVITLSTNSLTFNYTGEQKTVTVTNTGNSSLSVTGYSPSSLNGISVSNFGISGGLAPGESGLIQFTRTLGGSGIQTFTINSNKTGGENVITLSIN
ncbi:MAG: hypothetical protein OEW75_15280, partial [Cyclobacteriaceae bacterium]|nr:hypothetical protein [Cyclobacteriaceae bacterium]